MIADTYAGTSNLQLIFALVLIVLTAISYKGAWRMAQKRKVQYSGSSVLLAYYTSGPQLQQVASGITAGLHYTAMTTTALDMLVYQIELPFSAKIHLVNIPRRDGVEQLDPAGKGSLMESVVLEGDYSERFNLFCEKGEQVQARYVMDPKAMVFSIDFCMAHDWEIMDNVLYFLQSSTADTSDDPTPMFEDIGHFVAEIRPRLATPLSDAQRNAVAPYGVDRREGLACPICKAVLVNHESFYSCPNGDGLLTTGRVLSELHTGDMHINQQGDTAPAKRGFLVCPSCGNTMEQVRYNGGADTIIDTCPHCPYRWVDGADMQGIVPSG